MKDELGATEGKKKKRGPRKQRGSMVVFVNLMRVKTEDGAEWKEIKKRSTNEGGGTKGKLKTRKTEGERRKTGDMVCR